MPWPCHHCFTDLEGLTHDYLAPGKSTRRSSWGQRCQQQSCVKAFTRVTVRLALKMPKKKQERIHALYLKACHQRRLGVISTHFKETRVLG